jgi:hypothetical protein
MNTTDTATAEDVKAQLHEALDNLAGGICAPEAARQARARMDHIRETNRRLFGEQSIAVELIRQTRDEA